MHQMKSGMSGRVALPKDARVAVCVPSNGTWRDQFGWSLAGMLLHTKAACPQLPIKFLAHTGSCIPLNRQMLVSCAIAGAHTHVLFLDSDMTFPPDTILRLLAHDKAVVGAVYSERGGNPLRIAATDDLVNKLTVSRGETGLRRIKAMGLGVTMIRASVFETVGLDCFEMRWQPEHGHVEGEDASFFRHVEEAGIEVYADMDLSWQVGHIGAAAFHLQQITDAPNG